MNDWLWALTAILAVLLVPAAGIAYQRIAYRRNQQQGAA